jgi:AraC family transcriptional regulator
LSSTPADRYHARFRRVFDFIDAHADEDLCLERLSGIAAFSKFHFQRQFSDSFGISVHKYVRLVRLKRASYALAFRDDSRIVDIALDSGYDGPESFARAFRKNTGQSPSEFRKQPQWLPWHATYEALGELRSKYMRPNHRIDEVSIVDFEATKVAALEYRGDPKLLGTSVRKFIDWRRQNGLPPGTSRTFNIVYAHPLDGGECHYDLCASTDRPVDENPFGVVAKNIPGGRCAMLRHPGSDDTLQDTVSFLYSQWLPQSGEELRDFPLFFQRVRIFPAVPEHEAITDVFLPLATPCY